MCRCSIISKPPVDPTGDDSAHGDRMGRRGITRQPIQRLIPRAMRLRSNYASIALSYFKRQPVSWANFVLPLGLRADQVAPSEGM